LSLPSGERGVVGGASSVGVGSALPETEEARRVKDIALDAVSEGEWESVERGVVELGEMVLCAKVAIGMRPTKMERLDNKRV